MIPADAPPSFDGHRETTFATVQAVAPFYSVLIRINPENPSRPPISSATLHRDAEADRRRQDLHFQDPRRGQVPRRLAADRGRCRRELAGDRLSAARACPARAQAYFIDGRQGRGARRRRPWSSGSNSRPRAFLPALADPFAFIYKKKMLDKDPHWYEKNVMGSGPFKFAGYETGQSIKGERNPDYYVKGLPYLDGFIGIFAAKQATRIDAIRADRAAMEFRGMPPSARDELVKELGDKITVQDSDWNCGNLVDPQPQAEAVRRRAGAPRAGSGDRPVERRAGARQDRDRPDRRRHRLPRLAAGGDQGGAAADRRVLARHREVARRGQAAAEGGRRRRTSTSSCSTATSTSPTNMSAPWLIDEWSKIGLKVTQKVLPTGPFFDALRTGNFDVTVEANCHGVVNPLLDIGKFLPHSVYAENYGNYDDDKEIELYQTMLHETDPAKQRDADARVRKIRARHPGARDADRRGGIASCRPGPM